MKVLYLNSEYNGCAYWRMFEPARFLNMHSKDISVTYFPNENYAYKTLKEWERLALSHDLIVCARVSEPESLQTMLFVREVAQSPIVVELDDDWQTVEKENISYHFWHKGSDSCKIADSQMQWADIMHVSTFPLKRAMLKYKKPTYISPNLIDYDKWQICKELASEELKKRDHVRIGWAGGANHYGDWLHSEILEALEVIAVKYPTVEFVFRGMNADFFKKQASGQEVEGGRIKIVKGCFTDLSRIDLKNGVGFWEWPKLVAEMDLDIVIVPLNDSVFNKSKSNCRYLEFSSLGIAGVYSDIYPYHETIEDGVTGYLVKNKKKDWIDKISHLIEDVQFRQKMGHKAQDDVYERFSLQKNISVWANNLQLMYDETRSIPFISGVKNG